MNFILTISFSVAALLVVSLFLLGVMVLVLERVIYLWVQLVLLFLLSVVMKESDVGSTNSGVRRASSGPSCSRMLMRAAVQRSTKRGHGRCFYGCYVGFGLWALVPITKLPFFRGFRGSPNYSSAREPATFSRFCELAVSMLHNNIIDLNASHAIMYTGPSGLPSPFNLVISTKNL